VGACGGICDGGVDCVGGEEGEIGIRY
jgi:hypothetical protein